MAKIRFNAIQRNATFAFIERIEPAHYQVWNLLSHLSRSLGIDELRKRIRKWQRGMRCELVEIAKTRDAIKDSTSEKQELQFRWEDTLEAMNRGADFMAVDADPEVFHIDESDIELLYELTETMRDSDEASKQPKVSTCESCRRPHQYTGADWQVWEPICDAIRAAYEHRKDSDEKKADRKAKVNGKSKEANT